MNDKVRQLQLEGGNFDFLPQAILRGSIEDIEEANQIKFAHYEDDLDGFNAAVLAIESDSEKPRSVRAGNFNFFMSSFVASTPLLRMHTRSSSLVFLMQRYDKEPVDRITVFLPKKIESNAEIIKSIRRVLKALNIEETALIWEREHDPEL